MFQILLISLNVCRSSENPGDELLDDIEFIIKKCVNILSKDMKEFMIIDETREGFISV